MSRVACIVCVVALLCTRSTALTNEPLEVRLSRHVMTEPGALMVTIFVERDEDNRSLTIEADSAQFYRSSFIQLDGASAPRTHSIRYSNLPEGEYLIRVALHGARETLVVIQQQAQVRGDDVDSPSNGDDEVDVMRGSRLRYGRSEVPVKGVVPSVIGETWLLSASPEL